MPGPDDHVNRARALETIAALARQHALSPAEIAAAIGSTPATAGEPRAPAVLVHVLGFLGGTFVFAGLGVFIALQWSDMNSAARVVVTLGSGVVAFVLASVAAREARFDKAVTPLFLIAAVLEPTGMLVAFQEYGTGGDARVATLITAGTVALQFGLTFGAIRRATPLFMTVLFGTFAFGTALDLLDADSEVIALVLGASLLLAAVGADRTSHRDITPAWYLFGGAAFLYGVFDLVERTPLEIVFIAMASGFVYLEHRAAQPHAALRQHDGDPGLHRMVHQRALHRFRRLAAGPGRVRAVHDRPERRGASNRSPVCARERRTRRR